MKWFAILLGVAAGLVALALLAASQAGRTEVVDARTDDPVEKTADQSATPKEKLEQATFGTGCFWCTEAVFDQLKGVKSVVSGYSGGSLVNPTYEQVCGGLTGHAEVVQISYDPAVISFTDLLEAFWQTHDPTTLNRQGNDVGTQYRSVIFYHNDQQCQLAEHFRQQLDGSGAFRSSIVTEISPFKEFFPAEDYHQEYFNQNPRQSYCAVIIRPKVDKFKKAFKDKLKETPAPVDPSTPK